MIEIKVFTGGSYFLRTYFNDDSDNGVEVYDDGENYIGKIVGESLPYDDDELERFESILEDWLIDNE